MSGCPFHQNPKLKAGLPSLTSRLASLPVDERGYPIPFFVQYVDGKPEFRAMDRQKWQRCHRERLCWVCGQKLGKFVTFCIGPMCSISRTTGEPPSHKDCAEWSVVGCPFLSKPHMVRREDQILGSHNRQVAGNMIERNPGVTCLWTVETTGKNPYGYKFFQDGEGGTLMEMSSPSEVGWWREGRPATRVEVAESIRTGLPALEAACDTEPLFEQQQEARRELGEKLLIAMQYLPEGEETKLIITG